MLQISRKIYFSNLIRPTTIIKWMDATIFEIALFSSPIVSIKKRLTYWNQQIGVLTLESNSYSIEDLVVISFFLLLFWQLLIVSTTFHHFPNKPKIYLNSLSKHLFKQDVWVAHPISYPSINHYSLLFLC